MAKKKYSRRGSRGLSGFAMKGFLGPKVGMGLLGAAAVGLGAAYLAPRFGLNIHPAIVGGAAGGIPGAIAGMYGPSLIGGLGGSSSGGTAAW